LNALYETEDEIKAAGLTQEQVKREIRKLKNRIAAQKCREQKEVKITQAEDRVKILENDNLRLRNENDVQSRKIAHLEFQVKQHIIKCGDDGKDDFPQIFGYGHVTPHNNFNFPYQITNNSRANPMQMNHPQNSQSYPVPVTQMSYNNVPITHNYSNSYTSNNASALNHQQHNSFTTVSAQKSTVQQHVQTQLQSQNHHQTQAQQPSATIKNLSHESQGGPMPPQQIHHVYDSDTSNDNLKVSFHTPETEKNVLPAPEIKLNTEPFQSDYPLTEGHFQSDHYNSMPHNDNNNKFEPKQPIIKRRNSNTIKRKSAQITGLNLSNISNIKSDSSPNKPPLLPQPRRSPRNHIFKQSGIPSAFAAPKTKDVINDLLGGGDTFNFNPLNATQLLETPTRIEKEVGMIEQSLRNTTTGFTPFMPVDGPVTRSAKKKRGEANSSFLF